MALEVSLAFSDVVCCTEVVSADGAVVVNAREEVLPRTEVVPVPKPVLVDGCCEVPSTGVVSCFGELAVGEVTTVEG